jgi:hypothetical protein
VFDCANAKLNSPHLPDATLSDAMERAKGGHTRKKIASEALRLEFLVRPEGLEPPAY